MQVTSLEQRCQQLEADVQKLAQSWTDTAPAQEVQVSLPNQSTSMLSHAAQQSVFQYTQVAYLEHAIKRDRGPHVPCVHFEVVVTVLASCSECL